MKMIDSVDDWKESIEHKKRQKYRDERLFLTGIFGAIALWVAVGVSWASVAALNAHLYVVAVALGWSFGATFCALVIAIPLLIHWAIINELFE